MSSLQKIETTAKSIIGICQKELIKKPDKDRLLKLQGEIFAQIEALAECEKCRSIGDLIVGMNLNQVSAKLCKKCAIEALEVGEIKAKKSRSTSKKRSSQTRRKKSSDKSSQPTVQSKSDLHGTIAEKTGVKKTEVKKIAKLIDEIAAPMPLDNTIDYVVREASVAKLNIELDILKTIVKTLSSSD